MLRHLSVLLAVTSATGSIAWMPATAQSGFELVGTRSGQQWERDIWRGEWDSVWDSDNSRFRNRQRNDYFPGFSLGVALPIYGYYTRGRDCSTIGMVGLYCRAY